MPISCRALLLGLLAFTGLSTLKSYVFHHVGQHNCLNGGVLPPLFSFVFVLVREAIEKVFIHDALMRWRVHPAKWY